jgi:hypothetical protein
MAVFNIENEAWNGSEEDELKIIPEARRVA